VLLLWCVCLLLSVASQAQLAYTEVGQLAADDATPLGAGSIVIILLRLLFSVILCYQAVCLLHMHKENKYPSRGGGAAEDAAPKTVVRQPVVAETGAPDTAAVEPIGQAKV